MGSSFPDLRDVLRDTVREAASSWRLPVVLALGLGFGLVERTHTGESISLYFGIAAALYTLFLAPLPWRVLAPLEADGNRARKFLRGTAAAVIALVLFAMLVVPYLIVANALDLRAGYLTSHPRELVVSTLLFLIGGWGLARDVQLEQRLDRSLRSHGQLAAELEEARLYALQADLDPHFLFNALNAIASRVHVGPAPGSRDQHRAALFAVALGARHSPAAIALAGRRTGARARLPRAALRALPSVALRRRCGRRSGKPV